MTTLRLAIDASAMQAGGRVGEDALRRIKAASASAVADLEKIPKAGQNFQQLSRSFGVAQEALSIGNRVRGLGLEFEALGKGMGSASTAALLFGQTFLDVAQIMARANAATAASGGFFARLFASIRANPLTTIAVGLSAVAIGMQIFGSRTEETTKGIRSQADALRELRQAQDTLLQRQYTTQIREQAGIPTDTVGDLTARRDFLVEQAARLTGEAAQRQRPGSPFDFGTLDPTVVGETLGISVEKVFERFGRTFEGTVPSASVLAELTEQIRNLQLSIVGRQAGIEQGAAKTYGPELPFTSVQQAQGQQQLDAYIRSLEQESELLGQSEEARLRSVAVINAENIAKQSGITLLESEKQAIVAQIELQQRLVELRQIGVETGQAIANSFFSIVNGANSARQALAQLIQQLIALAQQRAIAGFGNALGQVFAGTAVQRAQDGAPGGTDLGSRGTEYS